MPMLTSLMTLQSIHLSGMDEEEFRVAVEGNAMDEVAHVDRRTEGVKS